MATAAEAMMAESGLKTTSTSQGHELREARAVIFVARRPLLETGRSRSHRAEAGGKFCIVVPIIESARSVSSTER